MSQHIGYSANARLRWTEVLPWVFSALVYYYLPEYLSLGARVLIYILFALSLDLIVAYFAAVPGAEDRCVCQRSVDAE